MKICILPTFGEEDKGDGGIRRVVEAQRRWLPTYGWEIVDTVEEADVVATHAGIQAPVDATKPLVSHCHGLYWYGYAWPKWALKMNRDVIKAIRRSDVVTATSEWVAHAIARGTNRTPVVLYHGIEPNSFNPPASHGGYVLWNKLRIDPICDPKDMQNLARLAPDVQFKSTFIWPLEDHPDNVELVNPSGPAIAKPLIENAGVYLCTTRETFGIGTLEAMASGVPVLGWDWGGQAEIVRHKETGWLAPPGDYPSLLEGLRYCFDHRKRMGEAARETVLRDFTWQTAMGRYGELYQSLLDRPSSPKISVVIPAYNMETLLPDAVKSVLDQDYTDYEVIIVDDASTDGTGPLSDRMASGSDERVRVVHNATNQYLAEALNVGITASRGRYILPLDADNMLGSGALGILARALDADRDIDIAYGAMSVLEPGKDEWVSPWPQQFEFRRQLKHHNQIPSTSMYRREAWERVGGYRRRCRTAEDADFWCRATSFGANAKRVTDATILRYRDRNDSMSHVVPDWPWHEWYPWGKKTYLTPWLAPVDTEKEDPAIPAHEFPMVSVVIPIGPGHERYVLDALDSLSAQTLIWWEAIVVNDTGGVIPWLPSWARVVDGSHQGAGHARNVGMAMARGKFFTFLDADDYLQPQALELMVLEQRRAGGFVFTDWYKQESGDVYVAPEWGGCDSVLSQLPWPVTCLYPREVWHRVGGFDETLTAWEDWDFAIRVVERGYCGTRLAIPLFHYRIESGTRREAGFADREELKQKIYDRWSKYISREVKMPCGCSGGGGLPSLPALDLFASANAPMATIASEGETELIEYTGEANAPITYSGSVTGTRYKFSSADSHRVRWVYKQDVARFMEFSEFRRYADVDAGPALAAAGPPR